jgi:hypothetical protein
VENALLPGEDIMPAFTLTDTARNLWTDGFHLAATDLDPSASPSWAIRKQTLHGGRRAGVDLVEMDNGLLRVAIVPTRGMGIWKIQTPAMTLGWHSPVADGPVHPAHVNLWGWGGKGWLDGFDELLSRCGLEHNGAPYEEKVVQRDGSVSHTVYPLHGRIANIPAHHVSVHVGDGPTPELAVEGHVDEVRLFGPHLRMISRISMSVGSNRLDLRDEFVNLGDQPGDLQVLYHWNLGPPLLEEGSRLVAPIKVMAPRDARAVEGLSHFDVYEGPEPGFAEQVYFFELLGDGPDGRTLVMLRDRAGDRALVLRFAKRQLPCFSLWKNTGGLKDGYVTGLEPATNYPNPKPFEKQRQRVLSLAPGARHVAETTLWVLDGPQAVTRVETEIRILQAQAAPTIYPKPVEPFAPED